MDLYDGEWNGGASSTRRDSKGKTRKNREPDAKLADIGRLVNQGNTRAYAEYVRNPYASYARGMQITRVYLNSDWTLRTVE